MALPIDQKEYLKRYLSAEPEDSKKKKRRKKVKTAIKVTRTFTIVDDDVDIRALAPSSEKQDDIDNPLMDDETPFVAEIIDERPKDEVILEQYRTSNKWRTMGDDDQSRGSRRADKHSISRDGKSSPATGQRRRPRHDSSDSDLSPERNSGSRRGDTRGDRPSARPVRHDSDSDLSPPRKGQDRRGDTKGGRPSERPVRHDSDSDLSPPRKGHDRRGDTRGDRPSSRPARHDSDSDLSPPRKGPDRRGDRRSARPARHDSDSDLSPPRKGQDRRGDRRSARPARHDSDSDLSPPRKGQDRRGDRSSARPSRLDSDSDPSPPRQKHRQNPDFDLSPAQQAAPRKGRERPEADSPRKREDSQARTSKAVSGNSKRAEKTLSGTTAGLSDAKSMRRENQESRRRDADMYSKMADDVSGKNAKTVFRDKSGRLRDLDSEKRQKREEDAKKAQDDQKFVEWGKGVTQSAQQKELVKNTLQEMDKPLARYRDDQDLDDMLKGAEREGDPMMAFLKKKQTKTQAAMGVKAKPKYKGPPPPPNRFNIMPGYRWDGVDRSNGFEKKAFVRQADKKATKEIAYKWSIEDM
ncbi:BUD13 homolog isoform X3 [Patiria miniata]|uniref:BUD13 homolog n=1 Tax=Patiria miniata TaxID=46514 RepID=A0A914AHH7_PATMI|nr:BUD13 homolog isoform X3 [Patiria miniata]